MDASEASLRFEELRTQKGAIDHRVLDEVFDALEPIDCESILGRWKGTAFDTGHSGVKQLDAIRWYGKTFNSRLDVQPVVCYDESGELYPNSEIAGGGASLWMVEFRGTVSATMVYDGLPVLDHFRRVDDRTLMGIMNGKEMVLDNGEHLYFLLDRV